jgi:phenylpyruvate tautomerase PptA (4-oxalocrotonate tautomerase family)
MPIATITVRGPKPAGFETGVLDAVYAAPVASGVNAQDRFHRVLELGRDDVRYDSLFPDLTGPRGDDFVLIETLLGVGRSAKIKRKILADVMAGLERLSLDTEHVMVVLQHVPGENWSPGGGRMPNV